MKRILSIFLCVAMLMSMVSMTVGAVGEDVDQVKSDNVMTFTLNQETYKPGDTLTIAVAMDSIWGNPDLEGTIKGFDEDDVRPGAYGMASLSSMLVLDLDVFTPTKITRQYSTSDIINGDGDNQWNGHTPANAKSYGCWMASVFASPENVDGDAWGYFNGSGDLWTYSFTINEGVVPGKYYIPVGPYSVTTPTTVGKTPVIKFTCNEEYYFANNQDVNSLGEKMDITYVTNYSGDVSLVDTTDPVTASYGTQYEAAYIEVVVEGDITDEDIAAAAEVDALIDAIGTVQNSGTVTLVDTINNGAPYTHIVGVPETDNFTVSFKMMPIAGGETFGYFGGTTDANGDSHNIFWNAAEKKFQIADVNNWVAPSSVDNVVAESEVMDLPANKWTEVEYIYNGSNLAVKVNGEIVCSTDSASTGYSFYIMYPSQCSLYVKDMVATGDFGTVDCHQYFTADAFSTVELDSGTAIAAAEEAYAALSPVAQTLVTKKAVLDAARAEYDAIPAYYDQVAANKAIALIDAIGTVSYPASEAAIVAAEEYVATLTETQLGLVTNYETLTVARAEFNRKEGLFNQAKADYVIELIDKIGEVTFESRAAIEEAEAAYAALTADQQTLVSNYQTLVDARAAYDMYAPIMNAENLINAIGTEFKQGTVIGDEFGTSNGYCVLKDQDNDNIIFDLEFNFDFMYASAKTDTDNASVIGLFRGSKSNVGYDLKTKSFFVGNNGGFMNGNKGPDTIYASAEYELYAGRWYNMDINWTKEGLVTIKLDGVTVLTCDLAAKGGDSGEYSYTIFYPQNVDLYIGDYTYSSVDWGWAGAFTDHTFNMNRGVDVISPVDIGAKIDAADAAVAALTEEQAALLGASYTEALATAKAAYDSLYAELVADAAAVDALIAAMATDDDVVAAVAAYNALLPGAKTLVANYATLEAANANLVVKAIDALGTITPASADAIAAADAAYAALTANEKTLVTNYATLEAARNELKALNAAVKAAEDAIDLLKPSGTVIKNTADNFDAGSYSQILDKAENIAGSNNHAPYTFSMDVLVESINAQTSTITVKDEVTDETGAVVTPKETVDVDVAYIGWASANSVFVAYDLVNSKFVVANNGPFKNNYAETLAGLNTVYGEVAYDLALNTWYNIEFVVEATYVEILVDGESVLKVDVDVNGYNIFYPVNNTAYYDNYMFAYNGAAEDAVSNFTSADTATWVAHVAAYSVVTAPVEGEVKKDADLVAAARAAYDAVPEKAQYAVANYALLVEAETPDANPVEDTQALIDALNVPEVTVDNYAEVLTYADAIAEAKAAYDALTEDQQAEVNADALDVVIANYNKAVVYDYINGNAKVSVDVTATGGMEEITISWNALDSASRYWVYVDGVVYLSTEETSVTIPATVGDHTVAVQPCMYDGIAGEYAADISAEVAVTVAVNPDKVLVAMTTATENSITVSWNEIDDAIDGYYAFITINGVEYIVGAGTDTTCTLAYYVTPDTEYSVVVKGYSVTATYESAAVTGKTDEAAFRILSADAATLEWTAVEGAENYWVVYTDCAYTDGTYRVAAGTTTHEIPEGATTAVVRALVDGKVISTAVVDIA